MSKIGISFSCKTSSLYLFMLLLVIMVSFFARIEAPISGEGEKKKPILLVDTLGKVDTMFQHDLSALCIKYGIDLIIVDDPGVEYFRYLEGEYSLILLRMHSTCDHNTTWLFTSETYSPNLYLLEQLAGEVHSAYVDYQSDRLFVVSSYYIEHYLSRRVVADCVILMGCNGAESYDMAKAWVKTGAVYYVGWSGGIDLSETDELSLRLVWDYLEMGLSEGIVEALPSEYYTLNGSKLVIYPD